MWEGIIMSAWKKQIQKKIKNGRYHVEGNIWGELTSENRNQAAAKGKWGRKRVEKNTME